MPALFPLLPHRRVLSCRSCLPIPAFACRIVHCSVSEDSPPDSFHFPLGKVPISGNFCVEGITWSDETLAFYWTLTYAPALVFARDPSLIGLDRL